MKILSITAQKPSKTGSGVYLSEVIKSLAKLGAKQAILYGKMPGDDEPEIANICEHTYAVNFMSDALPFAIAGMSDNMPYEASRYCDFTEQMAAQFVDAYSAEIKRAITEFEPDLIICHHLYLATAIAAHVNASAKIVGISHSTDLRQMQKHDLCAQYIKEGICALDHIFVLRGDQIEEVCEIYGANPAKVSVIGTGYSSDMFYAGGENVAGSIVFVGKICKQKGVPQLIEAASRIKGAKLTLVGGHSDEKEYEAIVRQATSSGADITFTGVLKEQTEVAQRYRDSQVFCLPSFFEGLPLVTLEAVASGCSAVMTCLPGIKEFYTQNTNDAPIIYVAPPHMHNVDEPDEDDLKAFVDELEVALRRAFTLKPNPESVKNLSWDSLAKRLIDSAEVL